MPVRAPAPTDPPAPSVVPLAPSGPFAWLAGLPPAMWPFVAMAGLALGGGTATGFSLLNQDQVREIVREEVSASEVRMLEEIQASESRILARVEDMARENQVAIREAILDERERNSVRSPAVRVTPP